MKKRKTNYLSKFFACMLTLFMLLSLGNGVHAAEAGAPAETDKEAAVTKNLVMPEGVETPSVSFTFKFEATGNAPALNDVTVNYAAADAGNATSGVKSVIKETKLTELTSALFANLPAGVYEYTVSETANTNNLTNDSKLTETIQYSQATYTMYVQMSNKADGSGTYIKSIMVKKLTLDDGTTAPEGAKIDPSPTPGETGNDFVFENVYNKELKKDPGTPGDPENQAFSLDKVVTGGAGDKVNDFPFSMTVTKPAEASLTTAQKAVTTFAYYIADASGMVAGSEKTVNYGTEFTFNLKHGQKIVLKSVIAGSKVTADETNSNGHTKTVEYTLANGQKTTAPITNLALVAPGNSGTVTNDKPDDTTVGFFLDNAPIMLMISAALVTIVAFVMVNKKRKYNNQ